MIRRSLKLKCFQTLIATAALAAFVGCNKGGNNNPAVNYAANVPPNGMAPNGQPFPPGQRPPGMPPGPSVMNQPMLPQPANLNSIDIVAGRIVGREFSLRTAKTFETYNNSCVKQIYGDATEESSEFTINTPQNNLFLQFDSMGNLTVRTRSETGKAQSVGFVAYDLDDTTQSIFIHRFDMAGSLSPTFVSNQLSMARYAQRAENQKDLGMSFTSASQMYQSFGPAGFRSDFLPVQQYAPINQPGVQPRSMSPALNVPSSQGQLLISFPDGISLNIQVSETNPQHVLAMKGTGIHFKTDASVSDPSGLGCESAFDDQLEIYDMH